MSNEKKFSPQSGYLMLLALFATIAIAFYGLFVLQSLWFLFFIVLFVLIIPGYFVVNPNESVVLTLFGTYKGTVKEYGFYWVIPFFRKKKISLRARNIDSATIKVNDKLANPIKIGVVLVWRVSDTFKAVFDVDDYAHFVDIQTDAAIRKIAGEYAYDNFDDEETEVTLRSGGADIDKRLEESLSQRLSIAGIEVMEARINYLAYSEEIAQAMLKRQQATAIIAARIKIVEGAVEMVKMAIKQLSDEGVVELDDERKAAMVSNLMVVLVSDKDANPIVNAGSLY
jgi:regulator of protease activity HflC (stomatin/prohibitin superfamily)